MTEQEDSVYCLHDFFSSPDSYYTDHYLSHHRGTHTPIVIDNGSWQCRAGWANEKEPRLVFRNIIARTRGKKGEPDSIVVGNDIANMEAVRSTLRSQYDHSLVTNYTCQEHMFDYCFSHLGLSGEKRVDHPVLVTEPLANPACCRSHMTELLFEAYGVPAVAYGVDALFSAHHNLGVVDDALLVSVGHQTVHLLPVLGGQPDLAHCKRVNVGGLNATNYLHRLLSLKYPSLQAHITLTRVHHLLTTHCTVSPDYPGDLRTWEEQQKNTIIQLPYSQVNVPCPVDNVAKDAQRRQRAREQLLRVNQRKKEEKIATLTTKLTVLTQQLESQFTFDPDEYQLLLEEGGFSSVEELQSEIANVKEYIATEQEKLTNVMKNLAGGGQVGEAVDGATEEPSEEWLDSLRERKKELLELRRIRQQKKQDLGKRRSAASQQRMRIISLLGAEESVKRRSKQRTEDTFGMDDDDWNVYRNISKDADESSEEREESELLEISKVLDKQTPSMSRGNGVQAVKDVASYYQLAMGVERVRVPEVFFQPSMLGVDQSGLSDTLEYMLNYYPPSVQQRLVQSVFVTGGASQFEGFDSRVETDLRCIRPYQSQFRVVPARDKVLDAWRGGASWSCDPRNKDNFVSRAEYQELGVEYFKEHCCSNKFITSL